MISGRTLTKLTQVNTADFILETLGLITNHGVVSRARIETLREYVSHPSPSIRGVTARCLGYGPLDPSLMILMTFLSDRESTVVLEALASIRQLLPWSRLIPWEKCAHPDTSFDRALLRVLQNGSEISNEILIRNLTRLAGATDEISQALGQINSAYQRLFLSLTTTQKTHNYPVQFIVIPSYRCNVRCAYCYADSDTTSTMPEMTLKQFNEVVSHAKAIGCTRISISGGEPTFSSGFPEMLTTLYHQKITTCFSTNAMFYPGLAGRFDPEFIGDITVHLRDRTDYSQPEWERFRRNVDAIRKRDIIARLRYNILPDTPIPVDLIHQICREAGIDQITMAPVIPGPARIPMAICPSEFERVSARIVDVASYFQSLAMRFVLAKPLPPCLFSPDQLRIIGNQPHNLGTCSIWSQKGTYNAVINPDESVWPCIAVNRDIGRFRHFSSLDELSAASTTVIRSLASMPLYEKCSSCEFFLLKRCQGACLSYVS